MAEELPLATIHVAVLEFLRGRIDAAVFGAQAVNAYVDTPRMTQDVDILSTCGEALSEELCEHLHQQFQKNFLGLKPIIIENVKQKNNGMMLLE